MNQQSEPNPSNPAPRPRRYLRARGDRLLGGVCGGLGRYFSLDPLLIRVAAVALTFFGGVTLIIYGALWVLVPVDDGSGHASGLSPLRQLLGGADGRIRLGRIAAVTAIVLGAALTAVLLVAAAAWATASGGGVWVAIIVIVIGLAAVAGALAGRRRAAWLIAPALLIAASAGLVAAADVHFGGGFGDRRYAPVAVSSLPAHGYELAAGRLRVDLRGLTLAPGTTTEIPIQLGMGLATIIVPASVCVESDTKVGAGYADVLGDTDSGFNVLHDVTGSQGSAPRVLLHAQIGMGALEIVHRPGNALFLDHRANEYRAEGRASASAACGREASA